MNRLIGVMLVLLLAHSVPSVAHTVYATRDRQINALVPLVKDADYTQTRTNMRKHASFSDYYQFTLGSTTPLLKVIDIASTRVQTLSFTLYHWASAKDFKLSKKGQLVPVAGCVGFTVDTDCSITDFTGSYVLKAYAFNTNNNAYKNGNYSFTLTAVPLPPAAILFGSVLFGLAVIGRRRSLGKRSAE